MPLSPGPLSRISGIAIIAGLIAALLAGLATGRFSDREPVMLTGLNAPRGLTVLDGGDLLVAEVMAGRLLRMDVDGQVTVVAGDLPMDMGGPGGSYPIGPSAAVRVDGVYYTVVGESRGHVFSALYRVEPGGEPQMVAGGVGLDGFPSTPLTNPYDIVAAPDGGFFVSDGGANAVFRITASGEISPYVTFERREDPTPGSNAMMDVVPTGLTLGPDGALYLASLTGYPYPSDAAHVYRLEDRNGDGDAMDEGETTVYATGFTVATDLAFDEDGSLLVTEFTTDMVRLVQEYGLDRAEKLPGRLVRWHNGDIQVVADDLVSPTAVAVTEGRIFVSEEMAGRVSQVQVP